MTKSCWTFRGLKIKSVIPYLTVVVALLFQTTTASYLKYNLVHPNMILIVTISWVILRDFDEGMLIALFAGLSFDFTTPTPMGTFSFTLLMIALLTYLFHDRILGRSNLFLAPIVILPATYFFNVVALILLLLTTGRPIAWPVMIASIIIPVSFLNTAIMLPTFVLLYFFNRVLDPPETQLI